MATQDKNRKRFAIGVTVLMTALTLVSLSASYSTYSESFKDWGALRPVLAIGTVAGVELAFALLVYGITYALIGAELAIAVVGTLGLLGVMAVNFGTHSMIVRNIPLSAWQQAYVAWVGNVVPFVVILLFLFLIYARHESRERRMERRIGMMARQRALEYKENYLASGDIDNYLDDTQPLIAAEVRKQLQLPAAARAEDDHRIGFPTKSDDTKSDQSAQKRKFDSH
jgi:large-conductance mechanosensitive channel